MEPKQRSEPINNRKNKSLSRSELINDNINIQKSIKEDSISLINLNLVNEYSSVKSLSNMELIQQYLIMGKTIYNSILKEMNQEKEKRRQSKLQKLRNLQSMEVGEKEVKISEKQNKLVDKFKYCKLLQTFFCKDQSIIDSLAKDIAKKVKFHFIPKGEPLYEVGDKKCSIFFILKGTGIQLIPKRSKQISDQKITNKQLRDQEEEGYLNSKKQISTQRSKDHIPFSSIEDTQIKDIHFLRKNILWHSKQLNQSQEKKIESHHLKKQEIQPSKNKDQTFLKNEGPSNQQQQPSKEEISPLIKGQSPRNKRGNSAPFNSEEFSTRKKKQSPLKRGNSAVFDSKENSPRKNQNQSPPNQKHSSLRRGNTSNFDTEESSPSKRNSPLKGQTGGITSVFDFEQSSPQKKKSNSLKRGNLTGKSPSKRVDTNQSLLTFNEIIEEYEQELVENEESDDTENDWKEEWKLSGVMASNEEYQACFQNLNPSEIRECFPRFFEGNIFKFNFGKILQAGDNSDAEDIIQKQSRMSSCIATSNIYAAELEKNDVHSFIKILLEAKFFKKVAHLFHSFENSGMLDLKKIFTDNSAFFIKKSYKKGQYIFKEGEVSQGLYILKSGEVEITKFSNTDLPQQFLHKNQLFNWKQYSSPQEISLSVAQVGQFFGEEEAIKNRIFRVVNSKCRTSKCSIYFLPNIHILRIMYESRDFLEFLKHRAQMKEEWLKKKYESIQQILLADQIDVVSQKIKQNQQKEYEDAQSMEGIFRDTLEKVMWKQSVDKEKKQRKSSADNFEKKENLQKQAFISEKVDILQDFLKWQVKSKPPTKQQSPLLLSSSRSKNNSLNSSPTPLKKQLNEQNSNPLLTNSKIQKLFNKTQVCQKLRTIRNWNKIFLNSTLSSYKVLKQSSSQSSINSSYQQFQQHHHFNANPNSKQGQENLPINESNNSDIEKRVSSLFLTFRELQKDINQSENFIRIMSSLQNSPKNDRRMNSAKSQSQLFEPESKMFLTSAPSLNQKQLKDPLPLQIKEFEDRLSRDKVKLHFSRNLFLSPEKKDKTQLEISKSNSKEREKSPIQLQTQDFGDKNNQNNQSLQAFKQALGRSQAQAFSEYFLKETVEKKDILVNQMEKKINEKINSMERVQITNEEVEKILARQAIMKGVKKEKSISVHSLEGGIDSKFDSILIKLKRKQERRENKQQQESNQYIQIHQSFEPEKNASPYMKQDKNKKDNCRISALQILFQKQKKVVNVSNDSTENSIKIEKKDINLILQKDPTQQLKVNDFDNDVISNYNIIHSKLKSQQGYQKQKAKNLFSHIQTHRQQNQNRKTEISYSNREVSNRTSIAESIESHEFSTKMEYSTQRKSSQLSEINKKQWVFNSS